MQISWVGWSTTCLDLRFYISNHVDKSCGSGWVNRASYRPLIGRISALTSNLPYGHNWPNNFNPTFANAAHRYCFDILGHPAHCLICPQRIQTHRDRRTPSGWLWQLPGILGGRGGVRVPAIRQSSMVPDYLGIFLKMGGARSSQFQKLVILNIALKTSNHLKITQNFLNWQKKT